MKGLLSSALVSAALTVGASSANALPSGGPVAPPASSLVEKVHGYHRHCAPGPRGWVHRHTWDDERVPCRHHYRGGGYYGGGHGYYGRYYHDGYPRRYYRDSGPSIGLRFGHW